MNDDRQLADIFTLVILMTISGIGMTANNYYIIGGCMVFLAGYTAFYVRVRGQQIHNEPPSDTPKPMKKYTKFINGKDFHFASFKFWGIGEYVRIYCVQTNRYHYAKTTDVQGITDWITEQI